MSVKQFLFSRKIGTQCFSLLIPCQDWQDAKDLAARTGMIAEGTDMLTIPCVPIPQLMVFLQTLAIGDEIKWKYYAEEQIEAFLSAGWPERPHEM